MNSAGMFISLKFDRSLIQLVSEIRYYDTLSIKHKDTKAFLHSHPERYPLKYDDGRKATDAAAARGQSLPLPRSGLVQHPLSYIETGWGAGQRPESKSTRAKAMEQYAANERSLL